MSGDLPPTWPDQWTPPRLSVADMLRALRMESERIITVQKYLIETGVRKGPDEGQLRRALALHKAEAFLVRCAPYWTQVTALLERLKLQGPRW